LKINYPTLAMRRKLFRRSALILFVLVVLWWLFALPRPLFDTPTATVLEDRHGELLSARIASDGQWRFPAADSVPVKFSTCVRVFEDRRFWQHPGVDIRSLARATVQNIRAGRIVSGASTLDMQVIRLSRDHPPRTLWQKMLEILLALRLEVAYDKDEIMGFWTANAPFGGNVVGLEAASWRYYGKAAHLLSWAEAATLAVLPNSPALIHPGRNRLALAEKRNRLLAALRELQEIDEVAYQLAITEPLPIAPLPLPHLTPHLLQHIVATYGPGRWRVSIDANLQRRVANLAAEHQRRLAGNGIHNLAVLLLDTETGQTLAYLGNLPDLALEHSPRVDLIQAPRSPGSLLKPLLYSLAVQDGMLLPTQLLPDIPSVFGGFRPENFYEAYAGAVPAQRALARSLNIPFVYLLQTYGVGPFHAALGGWQFDYVNNGPDHYGLSLILGGCEVSLWQATAWYAGLGRILLHQDAYQGQYDPQDWRLPDYLLPAPERELRLQNAPIRVGAGAAWSTLQALETLERPGSEGEWESFGSSQRMAWKTGTSFGFRDAWAVGVDPSYTIGVWAGNADGEGRPGLVGVQAAAPLLFAVRHLLPAVRQEWFEPPLNDLVPAVICRESGFLAAAACPSDSAYVPNSTSGGRVCTYHQKIHLDAQGRQVNAMCLAPDEQLLPTSWFVLPSLQAFYYRQQHPEYAPLPDWREDCRPDYENTARMQWIYPTQASRIKIPRNWRGETEAVVFSVAHREAGATIHWHLDGQYIATTTDLHKLELQPPPGVHQISLVDQEGQRLVKRIVFEE
jgi:penicillin-binding protein 1C